MWAGRALVLVGTFVFLWRVVGQLRLGVAGVAAAETGAAFREGAREGRLVLVQDNCVDGLVIPAEDRRLRLGDVLALGEETTLGRDEANDVVVGDRFTSGRHARIFRREEAYWVEDLGSKNGTLLNGHRLTRPQRLVSGDRVTVGSCSFRFMG